MIPFSDHIEAASLAAGRTFSRVLFLDLETRSELDLRTVDADTYARHHSTEIMCARWAVGDGRIQHWDETYFETLLDACPLLSDPETLVCVHNAEFEPKIFRYVLDLDIEVERLLDSAAIARAAGLPGALDDLAKFFGGAKDAEGHRSMLKLCKPRKPSKANPDIFWRPDTKADDFALMYTYCGWDVHWMRHAMERMPPLSEFETRVYWATYKMNHRGFPVDVPSAERLWQIVQRVRAAMSDDMERRHGFTLGQTAKIAEFLGLESVAKAPLRDLLKDPSLPKEHRAVALARQTFAKTSVDKLKQFIARAETTGSVHDGVMYGAAERTLRFAGRGVQPQNIPRGMGAKQIELFSILFEEGALEMIWGDDTLQAIADALRGLIAKLGALINVGDYSQIEARLLAWVVGDKALLGAFARGEDPYKMMASKIYGKPVETITGSERFMGKQTVLGCGYGLGGGGFTGMLDTTYDVQIEREEADTIVAAYRKNAPEVVAFWKRLEKALLAASNRVGTELVIIKGRLSIKFTREDRFFIRLPSGRKLRYYEVKKTPTRRGVDWSCFGRLKHGGGYGRVKIYGGALTGHIVQSAARDVVAEAMVNLDTKGHELVLTVHDELVGMDGDNYAEFEQEMQTPPAWLVDFPLAVEVFQTERYSK